VTWESDRYYRRQDPRRYRLLKIVHADGREEIELPPPWFVEQMRNGRNSLPELESLAESLTDEQRQRWAQSVEVGRTDEDDDGKRTVLLRASDIKAESVAWAWEGRLPLRAVSLLVGQPGLGKSTLQTLLAAQLSRGEAEGDLYGRPTTVLMASAEDSLTTTVRPRLEAAGADLDRVLMVAVKVDDVTGVITLPDDLERLRAAVVATRARVVMLDPVLAHMSAHADSHKDQHVRRVLAPLTQLADEHGIAVLGVMHLNKRESIDVLTRVSGSTGFTAAARSVLALGRDPQDESGGRVIAHAKCNVGPQMPSLACHIEGAVVESDGLPVETSRLVIDGESNVSADALLSGPTTREEREALHEAKDFLLAELADGERPVADLLKEAAKEGISRRTLYRARNELALEDARLGDAEFGARKRKVWRLPRVEE
jgi:putative DNA primase/helicase